VSHRLSTLQVAVPQVSSAVAKRYRLLEPICGTAATCVERPKPIDPESCPTIKDVGHGEPAVKRLRDSPLTEAVVAQPLGSRVPEAPPKWLALRNG
jgi:hypothetical protein